MRIPEERTTRQRVDLIWPAGYYARNDLGLEVVDGSGAFVGKEGDLVIGACVVDFKGGVDPPYHVSADEIEPAK